VWRQLVGAVGAAPAVGHVGQTPGSVVVGLGRRGALPDAILGQAIPPVLMVVVAVVLGMVVEAVEPGMEDVAVPQRRPPAVPAQAPPKLRSGCGCARPEL
jgi:hypothetical protein